MPRPPSIVWYYKQWLGDNKVLSMDWDARGMHFHLLMLSIQEEPPGTIPADDAAIRRWLSLPPGSVETDQIWRRVKSQLLAAWQPEGDRLANRGMVETLQRKERYSSRYETGTRSVRKKPENHCNSNSKDFDFAFKNQSQSQKQKQNQLQNQRAQIDIQQATSKLFLKLGLAGDRARILCQDAVQGYVHNRDCLPAEAADRLLDLWNRYQKLEIEFKYRSPQSWLEKGEWLRSESWSPPPVETEPGKCEVCNGMGKVHQAADKPGPRLIPCPKCAKAA